MGRCTGQEGCKGELPAYGDTAGSEILLKSGGAERGAVPVNIQGELAPFGARSVSR